MAVNVKNSLINISLHKIDFFISSFPGKIVFGELDTNCTFKKDHFLFNRREYSKFFEGALSIIKDKEGGKKFFLETADYLYGYETFSSTDSFKLFIVKNDDIVYSTIFSLFEFNNLIDSFRELILPSLLLRPEESQILTTISEMNLNQIIEFQDKQKLLSYLGKCSTEKWKDHIIINLNFDVIVLLSKLNKMVSTDYRKNFEHMIKVTGQSNEKPSENAAPKIVAK